MTTIAENPVWTPARIFRYPDRFSMPPKIDDILHREIKQKYITAFMPEFEQEILRETDQGGWMPIAEHKDAIPPEDRRKVGRGEMQCPSCGGTRHVYILHKGKVTGIEVRRSTTCYCVEHIAFELLWKDVPARYQDVGNPETVKPRNAKQAEHLKIMRAHPDESFYLFGAPETGKTHLSFALYHRAVENWAEEQFRRGFDLCHSVWRTPTSVLLQQHVDYENRNKHDPNCSVPAPLVSENDIRIAVKHGYKPRLFLDEIDKIAASEFKLNRLFEISNAIYEAKGQIVATSNKGPEVLIEKWGDDEAKTVLRRITGADGGHGLWFTA